MLVIKTNASCSKKFCIMNFANIRLKYLHEKLCKENAERN